MKTLSASVRASWFVGCLTLLGFAFRVYSINTVPLRGDEAFTVIHWIREPLSHTLQEIATVDPQPPLAYFSFWAWGQIIGDSEFVVRFLPALINTIGVPAAFVLGKRLFGYRIGLLAALFWAISPTQIWHAQDARNYALWSTFNALSLWLALRAVERAHARRDRPVDWISFLIAAWISGYLYYLELFTIAALNLFVFFSFLSDRRLLVRWFSAQLLLGLGLSAWYLQERLLVGSGYGGTAGGFELGRVFDWFLPVLTFGETFTPNWLNGILVILFGALAILIYKALFAATDRPRFSLLLLLILVPLIGISIVSFYLNVFVPRYVLSVSLILYLSIAVLLTTLRRLLPIFLPLVLLLFLTSLIHYYFSDDYAKSPDWRALLAFLADTASAEDQIINTSADEAFAFYHGEYGLRTPFVRLPANPRQSDLEITQELTRLDGDLWRVANPPVDWPNRETVDTWLRANRLLAVSASIEGMRAEYWVRNPEPGGGDGIAPLGTFPEIASVRSVRTLGPLPDGRLIVLATWDVLGRTSAALKVFVHLLPYPAPPDRPPLAQDDQFPADGGLNTETWLPGSAFMDVYAIDVHDLPPGRYQLLLGLYNPDSNERVMTDSDHDFIRIAELTLSP